MIRQFDRMNHSKRKDHAATDVIQIMMDVHAISSQVINPMGIIKRGAPWTTTSRFIWAVNIGMFSRKAINVLFSRRQWNTKIFHRLPELRVDKRFGYPDRIGIVRKKFGLLRKFPP